MKKRLQIIDPWWTIMKVSSVQLLIAFIACTYSYGGKTHAQELLMKKVSIEADQREIRYVLSELESSAGVKFVYSSQLLPAERKITLSIKNKTVRDVLDEMFRPDNVSYKIVRNRIILKLEAPNHSGSAHPVVGQEDLLATEQNADRKITGRVMGEKEALPGANVTLKGTLRGTTTDANGAFSMEIPDGESVLVFSSVGFLSQEVRLDHQAKLEVVLVADVKALGEVVVVGYGTQKKTDITGSVARADLKAFRQSPNANFVQMLQGSIPGLNVGPATTAGATPTLQVRGRSTISGTQSVLIVLDGIIYNGDLSSINPSDIESIDVLKDASSKAIYGAAAANGVLLVTSKKGTKSGKPVINVSSSIASQNPVNRLHTLNREQSIQKARDQNWKLAYLAPEYTTPNPAFDIRKYLDYTQLSSYDDGSSFDWYEAGTNPGYLMDHQLSISNATERVNYFVSAGYSKQKGFIMNDRFDRKSARINIEMKPVDWLTVGAQTFGSFRDFSGDSPDLATLFLFSPLNSPYNPDGSLNPFPAANALRNPFTYSDSQDDDKRNGLTGNFYGIIAIPAIEGLSYRVNFGNSYSWSNRSNASRWGAGQTGLAYKTNTKDYDYTLDNIVNYRKTLAQDHNIDLTLVYGARKHTNESNTAQGTGYTNLSLGYNSLQQAQIRTITSNAYLETFNYQTARLNYAFRSKYLLTATIRRDGFSGFAENKKWGLFPSVAVGWALANESFFKIPAINALKLRASYGANGNLTSRYASLARVTQNTAYVFGDGGSTLFGQQVSSLANSDLSWESTLGSNFGADFSILDNRISATVDYYNTLTKDLLFSVAIPVIGGFSSVNTNVGELKNTGIEVSVNTNNITTKSFQWNTTFNFSSNTNRIVALTGSGDLVTSNLFIGRSIGAIYDYKTNGIWQIGETPLAGYSIGTAKIVDADGNDAINSNDRVHLGRTEPAYRFSMLNSVSFKGFTLTAFINSVQGGKNGYMGAQDPWGSNNWITIADNAQRHSWFGELNYWTPSNPNAEFRGIGILPAIEGKRYQSRSFVRLQDISLGYNVPSNLLAKVGVKDLRIFVSGKNLMTWTKWAGWDPETGQGLILDGVPVLKAYSAGLNISF